MRTKQTIRAFEPGDVSLAFLFSIDSLLSTHPAVSQDPMMPPISPIISIETGNVSARRDMRK
jgi:hypothetical protein